MFETNLTFRRISGRNLKGPYVEWRIITSSTTFRIIHVSNFVSIALDYQQGYVIYNKSTYEIKSLPGTMTSKPSETILRTWNTEFNLSWTLDELFKFLSFE